MHVALVSPESEVWSGDADMVVARTLDGELGILPGHIPLLGVLVEDGHVTIHQGGTELVANVDGGFVSVTKDGVSILAERAELTSS